MDPVLVDWISLFLRWAHVMLGIAWIGTSFFFVWLDMSLRANPKAPPGVGGESWMVHGGGFYQAQKYLVAPEALPRELHWFKYEAYFTWVSGFLLLGVVYYLDAGAFLIDPQVLPLTPFQAIVISVASLAGGWLLYDALCKSPLGRHTGLLALAVFAMTIAAAYLFTHVFSGRAAFVHIGAFLGTIMSANVFFVIIPNQKKVVADLIAGRKPDPALGQQARQRSLHNNYLTLPVVLMMISNHYPILFNLGYGWLFVAAIILGSACVRHYMNLTDAGRRGDRIDWLLVYAAGIAVVLTIASIDLSNQNQGVVVAGPPVDLAQVVPIIQTRCTACHSSTPSDAHFKAPPKGIAFDTPEQIAQQAAQILRVAVLTKAMPLGNRTGMLDEERALVGRWAANAR
jgi:uncharacterized membrane protein